MSVAYGYLRWSKKSHDATHDLYHGRTQKKARRRSSVRSHGRSPVVRGAFPHSTHDCDHDWTSQCRSGWVDSEATTGSSYHRTKSSHTPQEFQWWNETEGGDLHVARAPPPTYSPHAPAHPLSRPTTARKDNVVIMEGHLPSVQPGRSVHRFCRPPSILLPQRKEKAAVLKPLFCVWRSGFLLRRLLLLTLPARTEDALLGVSISELLPIRR